MVFYLVAPCLRSWNVGASDNQLWHAQYITFFGNADSSLKISGNKSCKEVEDKKYGSLQEEMATGSSIDWKEVFRRAIRGKMECTSVIHFCPTL